MSRVGRDRAHVREVCEVQHGGSDVGTYIELNQPQGVPDRFAPERVARSKSHTKSETAPRRIGRDYRGWRSVSELRADDRHDVPASRAQQDLHRAPTPNRHRIAPSIQSPGPGVPMPYQCRGCVWRLIDPTVEPELVGDSIERGVPHVDRAILSHRDAVDGQGAT